ncbi:MAG: N-acetylneuraminate synthase [Candidatus Krumholzibacteriia bacterium]
MIEIIAEIGVNHDGSLAKARELVHAARACGADTAKFQTFKAANLVTGTAPTAEYQKTHHAGDQLTMLRRLELSADDFRALRTCCGEVGIGFLSTPFDLESLAFLLDLGVDTIKIGSGELTNLPLLAAIGRAGVRVILSTGMARLGEIETALDVLRAAGCRDLVLLHCVTQYPTPADQVNLRAMGTLRQAFAVPVGYSDHTQGNEMAIAAAALGAVIIEKHLTLDPTAPGPDHAASSSPAEFAALVAAVRNVEAGLGDGVKRPAACEVANMAIARKSLVAARDLAAGTVVAAVDLVVKRPGDGIAPAHLDHVTGLRLARPVARDTVLRWEDFQHG